jgi:hypothetical protein
VAIGHPPLGGQPSSQFSDLLSQPVLIWFDVALGAPDVLVTSIDLDFRYVEVVGG